MKIYNNIKITGHILKWLCNTSNILDNLGLGPPWDKLCCILSFALWTSSHLLIYLAKHLEKNWKRKQNNCLEVLETDSTPCYQYIKYNKHTSHVFTRKWSYSTHISNSEVLFDGVKHQSSSWETRGFGLNLNFF